MISVDTVSPWPPGFSQPLPRKVQLRQNVIYGLWFTSSGLLILLAFTVLLGFLVGHRMSQLSANGMHVQGTVLALRVIHGKGGPGYQVKYRFTDPAPPDPIEAIQSRLAFVSEAQFQNLRIGSPVEVVFLPRRPDISVLKMNLLAEAPDPWMPIKMAIVVITTFAMIGMFVFAWFYWRERRLLQRGQVTSAKVTYVWTEGRGRSAVTCACFEFADLAGNLRQGFARDVGKANQRAVGPSTRNFAVGDTATALYNPLNPFRADLYPLRLLLLAPDVHCSK